MKEIIVSVLFGGLLAVGGWGTTTWQMWMMMGWWAVALAVFTWKTE